MYIFLSRVTIKGEHRSALKTLLDIGLSFNENKYLFVFYFRLLYVLKYYYVIRHRHVVALKLFYVTI